jgi:DNA-binding transcriptional MerR regulator
VPVVLIDAATAADCLHIDQSTIRSWVKRGKLAAQGVDHRGRKLYDWDRLTELEAEGRLSRHNSRACAA